MPSPIVLFVYNRPWHTQQTVCALARNELACESDLIIFSDGPKSNDNIKQVNEVRSYLRSIKGFKSVTINESNANKGLANSIITGVTKVLEQYETIIVLEDDLITSAYFLTYMNDALDLYRDNDEVISVHGYIYPVTKVLPSCFFLKGADCWGWATWRRGWNLFEADGKKLLQELQKNNLTYEFDFKGKYPYTQMLRDQISGRNDSWAIRWYATAFIKNKLTLYPGESFVRNIGNDNSGTHSKSTSQKTYDTLLRTSPLTLKKIKLFEDKMARVVIEEYFKENRTSLVKKLFKKINLLINK